MKAELKNTFVSTLPSKYHDEISRAIWLSSLKTPEHFQFFYKMVQETLLSLKNHSYTDFDAQTTSNCCHGLSVLVRRLILALRPELEDLAAFVNLLNTHELMEHLPNALIDLTSIYILTIIVEIDPHKGRRTSPQKLKSKGNIGTAFCEKIVKKLQRKISIFVAESYYDLSTLSNCYNWLGKSSIKDWKEFLHQDQLRTDRNGVKYASCIFSMQVVLNHLLYENAKIALISDIVNPSDHRLEARYVKLCENIDNNFRVMDDTSSMNPVDPVIVFGGYTFSKELKSCLIDIKLQPWIYQLKSLILACDMHYPQFPKVKDDKQFNSSPILPNDIYLKDVMDLHSQIKGVSAKDPSLFCLSHIFVASFASIHSLFKAEKSTYFPSCYLPFSQED